MVRCLKPREFGKVSDSSWSTLNFLTFKSETSWKKTDLIFEEGVPKCIGEYEPSAAPRPEGVVAS